MLEKIQKNSVPQQVFEVLKKEIVSGTYQVGSKLPSENELCSMLGVSRPSVKAAIQQLCFLGMAETRPGDGTYVREFDPVAYFKQVSDIMFKEGNDIRELKEFRCWFEYSVACLAMKYATPEDFQRMDELLDLMDATYGKDYAKHAHYDYQLHFAIAQAAHNRYYSFMFQLMMDAIYWYAYTRNEDIYENPKLNTFGHDVHRIIVQTIKDKDMETCQKIYQQKFRVTD